MPLSLDFILHSTGGTRIGPASAQNLSSVCIDSRACEPGALFICLPGEKADGHDFAPMAVEKGCAAILASRNPFTDDTVPVPVVLVADPAAALHRMAADWRDEYAGRGGKVIGLTGTAGKTTVKEMLAHVLGRAGKVSRTPSNLNNNLGLPLSMINAQQDAFCWVIEAGISHVGDMEELGALLRPDLALVLNAGPGHTEGLGEKGTAYHKAQLLRFLTPKGAALVNGDNPDLVREARTVRSDVLLFTSSSKQVEYRAAYKGPQDEGHGLYELWLKGTSLDVVTPLRGAFAAENVAAVAAMAHLLGLSPVTIAEGFRDITLPAQRFCKIKAGNWLVIDDCYNANPLSMSRMLDAAAEISNGKPFYCMLGAMGELGSISEEEHEKLGVRLAAIKPDAIFWKGPYFEQVKKGLDRGRYAGPVWQVKDASAFLEAMDTCEHGNGSIIFKGSRANHLETFVSAFLQRVRTSDAV